MNRDRNTLKGFFTKGTIPSQENFADLIDSAINQNDDGISKLPNDPLRIDASGPDGTVLNFYQNVADPKPAWALNLISGETSPKVGLNVNSSSGVSRLFIDYASGNVGIGTTTPIAPLDIVGNNQYPHLRVGVGGGDQAPYGAFLSLDARATKGGGGKEFLIFSTGGAAGEGQGKLIFKNQTDATYPLALVKEGKVGVGTLDPQDSLDVAGSVRILSGSNPIRFTSAWSNFADPFITLSNHAEIANDTNSFKTLMIVGNTSAGVGRRVSIWDRLDVNGELFQHVPMIQVFGNGNWKDPNHPMRIYFREKLTGQPKGTILQAMGDHPGWTNLYWIGWVGSDGLVKISYTSNNEVTNN